MKSGLDAMPLFLLDDLLRSVQGKVYFHTFFLNFAKCPAVIIWSLENKKEDLSKQGLEPTRCNTYIG